DGALVVVQALERESQPVVLVTAFVLEQDGGAMVLCDEQVSSPVVVIVCDRDRARIFQLNLIEACIGGGVLPSIRPQVAEQFNFAFAIFRLAHRREIHPTVVVVVESSNAVGAQPIGLGKRNLLEALTVDVFPERNRWGSPVCKR